MRTQGFRHVNGLLQHRVDGDVQEDRSSDGEEETIGVERSGDSRQPVVGKMKIIPPHTLVVPRPSHLDGSSHPR